MIALKLLAYVAQGVLRTTAVELVDRHQVGEVEHVDLFQLAGGAELRRHHIERHIGERHDTGVTLADAGCLDDDEIEPSHLGRGNDLPESLWQLALRLPCGQRTHVDVRRVDCIHADTIAKQRTTGLTPRRIDGDDGDLERVVAIKPETQHELVGQG